ncbi:MAG: ribonuclease HI, partial [Microthrixaceae bacterium]|nr:ribonuclease HI [Microthrixaceae bacterium]
MCETVDDHVRPTRNVDLVCDNGSYPHSSTHEHRCVPMRTVYTDGACSGNPGPGGWAWVEVDGAWRTGFEADSTNQRMEVAAVISAVETFDGPLRIFSDSTYVVNCWKDRWWDGWLKSGWKNSQRKPVDNRYLWERLVP